MVPPWPAGDRLRRWVARGSARRGSRCSGESQGQTPSFCWCVGVSSPLAVQPLEGMFCCLNILPDSASPFQLTQINVLRQNRAHLQFVEIPRNMNVDLRPR